MRSALRVLVLAAAAPLLATCAGPGDAVIYNRNIDSTYTMREFSTQTAGRDLRTEIYGNPFAVDHAILADAVTTAMRGAHFGPETNFTETPGDRNAHPYKVRLSFNGAPSNGMSLCAAAPAAAPQAPTSNPAGGVDVRVLAAFCGGDSPMTSLFAGVDGVTGPDDPAFIAFIRRITLALFPPNNPDRNSDRCFVPGC